MKTERQQREEAIFEEALALADTGKQRAWVEQACGGDHELRDQVLELLRLEAGAECFFDGVIEAVSRECLRVEPALRLPPGEQIGTFIGQYKLLECLGEGGCGVVYLAEQQKPVRRRVALKIIKLGMDTKAVVARFEAERQALALMDHPNIARVLDAGATETGRPYFVMELVRGVKITDYCDQNRLDPNERLLLFIQVCHAIQHAHQKGVIHRDIKPSNILVSLYDGVPVPKVIDFGIAKAIEEPLTDKTLITAQSQLMGTPAYMSPEQAEMGCLDVDTRSDIYSLGVLLYELLTGHTPFDGQALVKQGVATLRQTLMEKDPPMPSAKLTHLAAAELEHVATRRKLESGKLLSIVHGDLDWIVLKALEKDRARRYQTANGLALELQRYLAHEPVQARPPGRLYRLHKLVRRNKLVFAATGAVAVALIAGLGFSTVMFLREREARKLADHLRVEAERGRANEQLLREEAESREEVIHAAALLRENRYEEADRLVAQIPPTEDNLEGAKVFRELGDWHALREEWKLASERFALLVRVNEPDEPDSASLDFSAQAAVLAMAQDRDGYEALRQEMIRRFASVEDSRVAERILKNTLLLPPGKETLDRLQPIVTYLTTYVEAMTAKYPDQTAWQLSALGLYHYRQGEFAQGAECCLKSLAYQGPEGPMSPRAASTSFILAMCQQRLGRSQEAITAFRTGQECVQKKARAVRDAGNWFKGFWFDWLDVRLLYAEANQLLDPAFPASEAKGS